MTPKGTDSVPPPSIDRREWFALAAVALLGLAIRVALWSTQSIPSVDGTAYLRMAQAFAGGPGIDSVHQYGYPALIWLAHFLIPDWVLAARVVALVAGTLLIPITGWLGAAFLRDRRLRLLPAAALAVTPLAIRYSLTTMTDMPFLALFFLGKLDAGAVAGNALGLASGVALAAMFLFLRSPKCGPRTRPQAMVLGNGVLVIGLGIVNIARADASLFAPGPGDLAGLAFLGVVQIGIAYAVFTFGIARVGALEASLIGMLEPVLNPIWVLIVLDERPGWWAVVGGAIITSNEQIYERMKFLQNAAGAVPGPFDSWLVLRGLKTLAVRMREHERNAQAVAQLLNEHTAVERVIYPGLPSHPQHALAREQMRGFGGMISIILKGGVEAANQMVTRTKLFTLAESLGGVESLIEVPAAMTHASVVGSKLEVPPGLVRLSVGIEDINDLLHDVEQSLG